MVPGVAYDGRLAWSVGYTGHGVGASRFGARIGIELLGYEPTDVLEMQFVTRKSLPWAPGAFALVCSQVHSKCTNKSRQKRW